MPERRVAARELEVDLKRAVELAREAMEYEASEARKRAWGAPSPDSKSVAALAAGIVVANRVIQAGRAQEQTVDSSHAGRADAGPSEGAEVTPPRRAKAHPRTGKRRRGRMLPLRERG